MNKLFIYRNHTIEHLFKGFEANFSGYDDIVCDTLDANLILWFYFPKLSANNVDLVKEIDSYNDRLNLVIQKNQNKKFIIFLLSSRLIKYFAHTDIELSNSISDFNKWVIKLCKSNPYIQFVDINIFFNKYSIKELIDWKFFSYF